MVLASPEIYFESAEQLGSLRSVRVQWTSTTNANAFLERIAVEQPAAIFLDPLANGVELRVTDVADIISRAPSVLRRRCVAVIDGTTLSGASDPFSWVNDERLDVFYYESGSKYLQLGLDLTLIGVVATRPRHRAHLQRIRRNSGTVLYDHQARLVPHVERADYLRRMKHMTATAMRVARRMQTADRRDGGTLVEVRFPGLHPARASASGR